MAEKRTRTLIRVGKTSLAVILPKPWLDFHNLNHGDQIEVITNGEVTIKLRER
jgi:antitoxin component of MazEF toxin-antitoxin module